MGKQRAELVQASQHYKGTAVVLGSQCHHMGPYWSHDASICQHCVRTHQHLHPPNMMTHANVQCGSDRTQALIAMKPAHSQ